MSHFSGHFEGASTFLTPKLSRAGLRGQKSYCATKKNYVLQFLKQRNINSYKVRLPNSNVNHIKSSKGKKNVLIWSAYNLNEGKNFDLVPVIIRSKSFPFCPKICGTKQSNLNWPGNCHRQSRTFYPKTNKSKQTFWFGSFNIGMKAKHFDLVQKYFHRKQIRNTAFL